MSGLARKYLFLMRRLLRGVLRSNHSPRQVAGGVALGVFIGFTPTMGCQMIIVSVVATIFRLSRIPAMICVYVTNPITAVPIYGSCYFLGAQILEPFGFKPLNFERIRALFVDRDNLGFWENMHTRLGELFALGGETLGALWLGCLLAGLVAGLVSYYVVLRFVAGNRLIKAERQARRARRRLERIRMEQELNKASPAEERKDA